MPLTDFQKHLVKILSVNRSEGSHLAGGAALHFEPNSLRYSNDLDFFHDSSEVVKVAFEKDLESLKQNAIEVIVSLKLDGFIRCEVRKGEDRTKIEWAHDSAWRFMPPVYREDSGFMLHTVDIAINKLLALAGRDEARDFLDILYIDKNILSIGALCWAAVSKDPGFSPSSLFELIQRRGKYREEEFKRLMYREELDLQAVKMQWLEALDKAKLFLRERDIENVGCLYYSVSQEKFIAPKVADGELDSDVIIHYGKLGGILPRISLEGS